MEVTTDYVVLTYFREFYEELIRIKNEVRFGKVFAEHNRLASADAETLANAVMQKILRIIEKQEYSAQSLSKDYRRVFEKARYTMAILADEVFLNHDWEGAAAWNYNLVESQLYRTRIAGQVFFEEIEKLLERQDQDNLELAQVYLLTLSVGFEGKFRENDPEQRIQYYKQSLFNYIFNRDFSTNNEVEALFPRVEALTDSKVKMFPALMRWLIIGLGVFVLTMIIQHIVWLSLTSDLRETVTKIDQLQTNSIAEEVSWRGILKNSFKQVLEKQKEFDKANKLTSPAPMIDGGASSEIDDLEFPKAPGTPAEKSTGGIDALMDKNAKSSTNPQKKTVEPQLTPDSKTSKKKPVEPIDDEDFFK